tara:strand:- start:1675 stop:2556 length:882 start_codon:yes stop_codon:yes gene_type:complete
LQNNITILLLGRTGLLGNKVFTELKKIKKLSLIKTQRSSKSSNNYLDVINEPKNISHILNENKDINYVINCIGITQSELKKYSVEDAKILARKINTEFPHTLCYETKKRNIKVIHISTDAVFSGRKGPYHELSQVDPVDIYGKSKFLGECSEKNFLNIRCSIIGPDEIKKNGLFEWFKSRNHNSIVKGFTNHLWNGITTKQFSDLCRLIIEKNVFSKITDLSPILHISINQAISKYELLKIFNETLGKDIRIEPIRDVQDVNRVLISKYKIINDIYTHNYNKPSWKDLVKEMV